MGWLALPDWERGSISGGNDSLLQIDGFNNLEKVGANLTVSRNGQLADCCGIFPALALHQSGGSISKNLGCISKSHLLDNCWGGGFGHIDLELEVVFYITLARNVGSFSDHFNRFK